MLQELKNTLFKIITIYARSQWVNVHVWDLMMHIVIYIYLRCQANNWTNEELLPLNPAATNLKLWNWKKKYNNKHYIKRYIWECSLQKSQPFCSDLKCVGLCTFHFCTFYISHSLHCSTPNIVPLHRVLSSREDNPPWYISWPLLRPNLFNSLRPSDASMHRKSSYHWFRLMACRLVGAKPLSQPMLVYCQLDP